MKCVGQSQDGKEKKGGFALMIWPTRVGGECDFVSLGQGGRGQGDGRLIQDMQAMPSVFKGQHSSIVLCSIML